jgi:hypothetical protein
MSTTKLILILAALAMVASASTLALAEEAQFLGAAGCKMCHSKDKSGNQFDKWAAGPHAGAYATLASDESKAIAAEMGLGDPQQEDACLKCHVTAHGVDEARLGTKYTIEDGVGCESCHGAGSEYKSNKTMKAITAGEIDGATVGLLEPNEANCVQCHNEESPTFKGFDYAEYAAKIAHPIPEEHLATYK